MITKTQGFSKDVNTYRSQNKIGSKSPTQYNTVKKNASKYPSLAGNIPGGTSKGHLEQLRKLVKSRDIIKFYISDPIL